MINRNGFNYDKLHAQIQCLPGLEGNVTLGNGVSICLVPLRDIISSKSICFIELALIMLLLLMWTRQQVQL